MATSAPSPQSAPVPMVDVAKSYLEALSEKQHSAVVFDSGIPLQILAGPGSGKTRVLTSRIVHLVQHGNIKPAHIVAVTFTNKAANEMRLRLGRMLGTQATNDLVLGTFHSTCVRYLRRHATLVGLAHNFVVQDTDDGKRVIKNILRDRVAEMLEGELKMTEKTAQEAISKAKCKSISPEDMHALAVKTGDSVNLFLAVVYEDYQEALRASGALDFDDLLVWGLRLFTKAPEVLEGIRHIFVDEFQDTNTTQYQLMKVIAKATPDSRCVTIVGDPDQSIYAWRSAEVENLARMKSDFPSTESVFLEENYRSTGAILKTALAVISQDRNRINKGLHTSHAEGDKVVLKRFATDTLEANFIAAEVQRVKVVAGLEWSDFAVLLRYNALSRPLEQAFQSAGVPCRIVGGHKFFERAEIMLVLAYLQLADNPSFTPAFRRVINQPKRNFGDASIERVIAGAAKTGISCIKFCQSSTANLTTKQASNVKAFIKIIDDLRKAAESGASVKELIELLMSKVDLELYYKDDNPTSRMENIKELINYSVQLAEGKHEDSTPVSSQESAAAGESPSTNLRTFLEASSLSTDIDAKEEERHTPKVTISTIHSAKGLEWPVVFLPCGACLKRLDAQTLMTYTRAIVENDVYPFYLSKADDEIAEERRLLYVAMTRAQVLLYNSYSQRKLVNGEWKNRTLSMFVPAAAQSTFLTFRTPRFGKESREAITKVLGRPPVDEAAVAEAIAVAGVSEEPMTGEWDKPASSLPSRPDRSVYWNSSEYRDEYALPPMHGDENASSKPQAVYNSGFTKASSLAQQALTARSTSTGSFTSASASSSSSSHFCSARSISDSTTTPGYRPRKLVQPPPLKDPPKFLPARLLSSDRYTLPPMDPLTTSSAHPSTLAGQAQEPPVSTANVDRFASKGKEGLDMMKNLGLPPPAGAAATPVAPTRSTSKRLGTGRSMIGWGESAANKKARKL